MIRSLYTAVSGMIALEAKQDVITNNMANANTTAYKADDLKTKTFKEVMVQNRDKVVGGKNVTNKLGEITLGTRIDETYTKFTQGVTASTDRDTDFAIEGRGFFTVQRGNNTYYTRDGHFNINNEGYLVTDNGDYVMGRDINTGAITRMNFGSSKITFDTNNNIVLNGIPRYQLAISDFNDYNANLTKMGDNLYRGNNAMAVNNANIRHKYLEKSNVNLTNTMVDLMSTMRAFETNQKMVQMVDDTLGKAATQIGKV